LSRTHPITRRFEAERITQSMDPMASSSFKVYLVGRYSNRVEVLPPDTNRGPSFPGRQVRLGFRKPALSSCRDEVLAAITGLTAKSRQLVFTVREVFDEMTRSADRRGMSSVADVDCGRYQPESEYLKLFRRGSVSVRRLHRRGGMRTTNIGGQRRRAVMTFPTFLRRKHVKEQQSRRLNQRYLVIAGTCSRCSGQASSGRSGPAWLLALILPTRTELQ